MLEFAGDYGPAGAGVWRRAVPQAAPSGAGVHICRCSGARCMAFAFNGPTWAGAPGGATITPLPGKRRCGLALNGRASWRVGGGMRAPPANGGESTGQGRSHAPFLWITLCKSRCVGAAKPALARFLTV